MEHSDLDALIDHRNEDAPVDELMMRRLKKRRLAGKIALVGTTIPSQAKALIMAGVIREGFLWSPKEAGLAMTSVARLALDGAKFESGMEIPGLGKANIDSANNVVMVDRILSINKNTIDALIKLGL